MAIYQDFKELLESFNAQNVEYVVVGAHALAHHGVVRATKDIDVYVRPSPANSERVLAALDAFGFGEIGLTPEDFQKPRRTIQLGHAPIRIDLITSIDGVAWEQAAAGRCQGNYGGTPIPILGRAELIANKKAAGRLQDLADVERLEESHGKDEGLQ